MIKSKSDMSSKFAEPVRVGFEMFMTISVSASLVFSMARRLSLQTMITNKYELGESECELRKCSACS